MPTEPTPEAPRRPRLLIPGVNTPAQPVSPPAQSAAVPVAAQPVAAAPPAQPAAPGRPALLVPGSVPAQPAVVAQPAPPLPPPPPVVAPVPPAPVVVPAPVAAQPTPRANPQPLTPPEGSRPSVHTEAQQLATQAVQAAQAPPPPPAQVPVVALAPSGAARPAPGRLFAQPGAAPAPQTPGLRQGPVVFSGVGMQTKHTGLSNGAKVAIAAVLGLLVVLLGMFLLSRLSQNKKAKEYNALVSQAKQTGITEISVNRAQVDMLLGAAISLENNRERPTIYQCLYLAKSSDGTDVDAVIADFATTKDMTDEIRNKLFEVLAQRRNPASVDAMLEYAKTSSRVSSASAALTNAKLMATEDHFPGFLEVVQNTSDVNIRRAAEGTAGEILRKSSDPGKFADVIVSAYEKQPNPDVRHSLLRLMGYAGGEQAKEVITKGLEDSDNLTKLNSVLALRNWPDDSMLELLMDFLEKQEDPNLRQKAFTTGYEFLMQQRKRPEEDSEELWKMLARNAKTDGEQRAVIDGVARQKGDWAVAVIEYFADEAESDAIKDRAGKALDYLREQERINSKDEDRDKDKEEKKTEEE